MQPIVWDMKCILMLSLDHAMQESISGKSLIITDTKSDNPKRHKKNKGLFLNDQYIEGVASDNYYTTTQ